MAPMPMMVPVSSSTSSARLASFMFPSIKPCSFSGRAAHLRSARVTPLACGRMVSNTRSSRVDNMGQQCSDSFGIPICRFSRPYRRLLVLRNLRDRRQCCRSPFRCSASPSEEDETASPSSSKSSSFVSLTSELLDTSSLGKRGEVWFVLQAVATVLVVFPPFYSEFESVSHILGLAGVILGIYVCVTSLGSLGNALSPFPKPTESAELVTTGMFAATRHPTYTGLLILAFSVAIQTGSGARTLMALVLYGIMHKKAVVEERFLVEKFGDEYTQYQATTPMLWPSKEWFQNVLKDTDVKQ
ncbi:isoprenylcysteine carboxyl methyltransferase [Pycnococcus provasolii]